MHDFLVKRRRALRGSVRVALSLSLLCVLGCTSDEGGGEGGASSSAASTGGGAGSGPGGDGGAGGAPGEPCTWSDESNSCGAGKYCEAPGCGEGVCRSVPAPASVPVDRTPVCGCDGNSYWNASVAASREMSVKSEGACAPGKTCGGFGAIDCPGALLCRYALADAAECAGADQAGECWGVPAECPDEPSVTTCMPDECTSECSAIQLGAFFVEGC